MARLKILSDILSLPTAPFHEEAISAYIKDFCKRSKLPCSEDKHENLVVHYKHGRARQKVILTAHMDHPGFEVISSNGKECVVGLLGGILPEHFIRSKVTIKTSNGIVRGKVIKKLVKKWHGKNKFLVSSSAKKGDFGWYDIPGIKIKRDILYTKGADNQASTAVLLDVLYTMVQKRITADIRCLFTRAEEVGFAGCVSAALLKTLPARIPIIVLECSSAKAGKVDIGGGPVVRVGDKFSCFDPLIDCWLKTTAIELSKKDKKFKFQRSLLAGGTCEATVWTLNKRPAGSVSFPLGNYHNIGEKGAEAEFISVSDYISMQKLLLALARSKGYKDLFKKAYKKILKNHSSWAQKFHS